MEIEWTETSLDDMADLDKGIARRIKQSVERFAAAGTGNVKKLQGIDPPEYRLRVGDYRVRFEMEEEIMRILRVRNRPRSLPIEGSRSTREEVNHGTRPSTPSLTLCAAARKRILG